VSKVPDNILLKTEDNIMPTEQIKPVPMTGDQLKYIQNEIKKIYLFLIGHTEYDPKVVEIMKLSALADVQRRFENREPW
jgi:hypothetical protein